MPINFCIQCGGKMQVQQQDDKQRHVCTVCASVHYVNPLPVVGMVAYTHDGKVLLCRRAIEPKKGAWSLPAGFMEVGESSHAAACRELQEETGAIVREPGLFAVLNVPGHRQVHLFYRGEIANPKEVVAGVESLEVGLFSKDEIDFEGLAFDTNRALLQAFFSDMEMQAMKVHSIDV